MQDPHDLCREAALWLRRCPLHVKHDLMLLHLSITMIADEPTHLHGLDSATKLQGATVYLLVNHLEGIIQVGRG